MTCSTLTSSVCLFIVLAFISYEFGRKCLRSYHMYRVEKFFDDNAYGGEMAMGAFHRMKQASDRALRQGAVALLAALGAILLIY